MKEADVLQKTIEFLKRCSEEYEKRNTENINKKTKNVYLGRSFPMGSLVQFLFAKEIFKGSNFIVLVDYPITFTYRKEAKTIYPDILILKEKENRKYLLGIIEMKVDLGFLDLEYYGIKYNKRKRTYKYIKKHNKFKSKYNELLKSGTFFYKKDSQKIKVKILKTLDRICIVITKVNDHGRSEVFEKAMQDSGFETVFLLENTHPRRRRDKNVLANDINKDGVKIIYKILKKK